MRFRGGCVGEVGTMEIPLPMLFPPTYLAGLEDDSDDVPPSPTPDPTSPSLTSTICFQRGFLDCAEEALRFLTEVEGMPEESPVIAGLKQHLVHSTEQFTPVSLAPPSPTFFTFPSPVSGGDVYRRKHSGLAASTQGASHTCVASARSASVRFSPYTVASTRISSSRQWRASTEKDSSASLTSQRSGVLQTAARTQPTTCPLTRGLESVLRDDVISADDLHGVLRCLQSVQPPAVTHPLQQGAPTAHPSTHPSTPICHPSVHGVHLGVVPGKVDCCGSFNDSGISADLTDELDGPCVGATDSVSDEVFICGNSSRLGDREGQVPVDISERNPRDSETVLRNSSPLTTKPSSTTPSTSTPPTSPSSSLSTSVSTSVPVSTATPTVLESSPSSQLSLLSSLSSGTHRLTAQSGDGSATATRIQSLANEILLLLQEEAEADNDDDESDGEDDVDDDDEHSDDASDEDSAVEMEP